MSWAGNRCSTRWRRIPRLDCSSAYRITRSRRKFTHETISTSAEAFLSTTSFTRNRLQWSMSLIHFTRRRISLIITFDSPIFRILGSRHSFRTREAPSRRMEGILCAWISLE